MTSPSLLTEARRKLLKGSVSLTTLAASGTGRTVPLSPSSSTGQELGNASIASRETVDRTSSVCEEWLGGLASDYTKRTR